MLSVCALALLRFCHDQTSDLLLAATEDMILKAGAIGRGLREMGAEVAEVSATPPESSTTIIFSSTGFWGVVRAVQGMPRFVVTPLTHPSFNSIPR